MTDVVVVGGGVGGLVVARDLAKGGAAVTLVEASGALGGMVRSHVVAGIALDLAADSFATRGDVVSTLAIELGLGNELCAPDPRGAWLMTRDGRTAPLPAAGLLGIPSIPMAADVLAVIGTRGGLRAQMDSLLPGPVGASAGTLGELVRRRMGARVLDDLVVPIAGGVHSTHPDRLPLDRVAPGLRAALLRDGSLAGAVLAQRAAAPAGSAVGGIRGGVARLVDELVADLDTYRVHVRLGTRAVRIDRAGVDVVAADAGSGPVERLVADHVVAGVPDPERTVPAHRTGIELVTLVVDQPALDDAPRGTGMLVHPDAPFARGTGARGARPGPKALTHATVKWPWLAERTDGRHVLRLSYAVGPQDGPDTTDVGRSVAVDPDSALAASTAADAATLLGVPLGARHVVGAARVRWHGPDTEAAGLADGVRGVGEASTGRGLAGIVAGARARAAEVLDGRDPHPA
ncbi:protoporphyrinogen/coproporphyrinogen oxidase [Curtobacterium sp. RRHDQ10]|uniref:protoporphyrinogen/coproporphyrinogen oxidase n=1 Tax=Curtobacterium phyllosphaerae TaxID=3413379 RepID=UPI003BF24A3E